MSREQQLRTVRAVSLNRAIDEHADDRLFPWQPNLIDWRHSLVIADKRADQDDETLEICAHCGCEVDITPQPHKPGCKGIGAPRVNGHVVLGEAAAPDTSEGRAASSNTETGPAGPPRLQNDDAPRAPEAAPPHPGATGGASIPFRHVWTRDEVVAALRRWAEEHGHAPTQTDWLRRGAYYPTFSTAARVFGGSWTGAITAAGLTPRGSRPRRATLSEREPPAEADAAGVSGRGDVRGASPSRSEGAVTLRDALCLLVHATRSTLDALERELTVAGDPGELARVVVRRLGDDT